MLCGLYEVDITPKLNLSIPGYFIGRLAAGVRDNLYARALACENDKGDSFILVSLDTIELDPSVPERTRARVEALTGVPAMHVMVASTHTHTGGPVDDFVPGSIDHEYMNWMADQAADAAVMAWKNRKPARIGYGSAEERSIAFIRRYYMKDGTFATNPGFHPELIERPAGDIDPEVGVVKIEDMDGKLIGVITNYACHLDTVGGHRYCADYPGELHRVLKSVYGKDVVSIFLTGACGNINHCDFMGHPAEYYHDPKNPHYIRMGRILAGDVIRALLKVHQEVQECDHIEITVQAARIGNAVIAGMPCELFVEHGKDIKARSAYDHTFVSTVTNAHYGYISIRASLEQGGYEATINGSTKMSMETGYDMVNTAVKLLERMQ